METNDNQHGEKNTNQPLNKMNENSVWPPNSDGVHDKHLDIAQNMHEQNPENKDIKNNNSHRTEPADEQMHENAEENLSDDPIDNDVETYNHDDVLPKQKAENRIDFTDINSFRL